jgi:membrane protein DedA with SNARE-associated domain
VTHLLLTYGLFLLFVVVAVESAGVPLPGEVVLITAAVYATPKEHHYSLWSVIVVASAGAIVGDATGYWLGRLGGRPLLARWGPIDRYSRKVLPPAERFFERHGAKAVFAGRFVSFLRVTSAWLAGIAHMSWWRFIIVRSIAGIIWAVLFGVMAYEFGRAAVEAVARYGAYAIAALIVAALLVFLGVRVWQKRLEHG